ncbi:MAG: hypothetical protein RBT64_01485 [Trichloromonas sp.]|jgi:hypothetical protein|nr:hypothetical protein [Trichloromonas sp.]
MKLGNNPIQKQLRSEMVIRSARNFLGMEHFNLIALGLAVAFFTMAGWIPDGITNLVLPGGDRWQGFCQLVFAGVVFATLGWLINHQIKKVHKIQVRVEVPEATKVLVVVLSSIGRKENERSLLERLGGGRDVARSEVDATSWEMPLLALEHHLTRLERLVVVTSQGDGGSHPQFSAFQALVKTLFPESRFIIEELTSPHLNFEDIAGVHKLLDTWYEEAASRGYAGAGDIITDLTGGQKPAGIAAALATLVEGRKFQYVSTTDKKVQSFDLVVGD